MCPDAIWQAFSETGDPIYYLLYKTAERAAQSQAKTDREELPPAVD